ncbi:MAG: Do family serine endopeptidase [Deltaproteobacteria bacterium]|nr:Do family serine endopeptidase [Deltaproteobacteria bacterium]
MGKTGHDRQVFICRCLMVCVFVGFIFIISSSTVQSVGENDISTVAGVPDSFARLVKLARESVVNISTTRHVKESGQGYYRGPFDQGNPFGDFFEHFFENKAPQEYDKRSLGSGLIVDEDGFILTNNHVVEKTDKIKVTLFNGKEFDARIIGRDPKTDIALIKINTGEPMKLLPFGDSDGLEVGDWVIAIGNPFGLDHTVTAGIVSAKARQIRPGSSDNFIQTDASINPGNSGGPLLNVNGEVVGISSAIYSRSGGSMGIGFAIPINIAKTLLPQLKQGRVTRSWVGVMIQKITPELVEALGLKGESGALVADIAPDSPAEASGILRGDVIVSFDGKAINDIRSLPFVVAATPVDKDVAVEVMRKGDKVRLTLTVGELEDIDVSGAEEGKALDLGMVLEEVTPELAAHFGLPEKRGLLVVKIDAGSPAETAGILTGDIVIEMGQEQIQDLDRYSEKLKQYKKEDTVLFLVNRDGTTLYLTLKVRER